MPISKVFEQSQDVKCVGASQRGLGTLPMLLWVVLGAGCAGTVIAAAIGTDFIGCYSQRGRLVLAH